MRNSEYSYDSNSKKEDDIPFKIEGQEIEKSIVYELPNSKNTQGNPRFYEPTNNVTKTYKVQKEIKNTVSSRDGVLCLNCNAYVRLEEVDDHSLSHVKLV